MSKSNCYRCGVEFDQDNAHYRSSACKDCERDRLAAYQFEKAAKERGLAWARAHVERKVQELAILQNSLKKLEGK